MREKKKIVFVYIVAFILPFLIMGVMFIKLKIYPFGDKQALVADAWHQYYPFLLELSRKVKGGESLLYSWRLGLGSDFIVLIAYYLVSPFNLIAAFVSENWLREAYALMILVKIGVAGSFCAYAFVQMNLCREENEEETESKINDYGILLFSTFYALCGWVQGYYWNIMWLDSFAVFPLVALGICQLVKEKKYKLYTISLAVAILFNFYIGLLICIFMALFFFIQCIVYWVDFKELWKNLKYIVCFSAMSLMISFVFMLPTFLARQNAFKGGGFPSYLTVTREWLLTFSGIFAYREFDSLNSEGLPHIYCGILCLLFLFAFFRLPQVPKKEKAAYGGMVLFMLISMNINVLDYLLHGFHFTNSMPYRFSFMLSFLMVMMAYRVYVAVDTLQKKDLFIMAIAGLLCYLLIAGGQVYQYGKENACTSLLEAFDAGGSSLREFLLKNLLIMTVYLILLTLLVKRRLKRKRFSLLLIYVAGLELVSTVMIRNDAAWSSDRSSYPDRYVVVREALAEIEKKEGEQSFYRTEFVNRFIGNAANLYNYYGITFFSSTINAAVVKMFENMGLPFWDNGYYYQNTTPVNNLFLNLKYLIAKGEDEIANPEYLTEMMKVDDVVAYQNKAYLPIGFMVENSMADFDFEGNNPLEKQNNLLKATSGIDGDIFEALDIIHVGHENVDVGRYEYGLYHYEPLEEIKQSVAKEKDKGKGKDKKKKEAENEKFKFNYEMPKDGSVYVYMDLKRKDSSENIAKVEFDDKASNYGLYAGGNFFPAGTYQKGDVFSVRSETEAGSSGDMRIFVGILNQDMFEQAYELLKDETLEVTEWDSTHIKGNIAVKKDNLLYTSIPCEKGWKVYVDGARTDITLIADAFVGVMLPKGEHTVEFVYSPTHVYVGIIISLVGIGLFVLVVVIEKKRKVRL